MNILLIIFLIGPWNGKAAAFTFTTDDGYIDNMYWKKVFDSFGYNFTAFIVAGAINQGGLTTNDLNDLHNSGHEIASHSITHPFLIKDSAFTIKYIGNADTAEIKIDSDTLYLRSSLNENYKFYLKDSSYKYLVDLVNHIDNLPNYECSLKYYLYRFWPCESKYLIETQQNIKLKRLILTNNGCSLQKMIEEIKNSKSQLESFIVDQCNSFAYPFDAHDYITRIIVKDSAKYLGARNGTPSAFTPPFGTPTNVPNWDSIYLYEISIGTSAYLLCGNNTFTEQQTRDSVRKLISEWKKRNSWIISCHHTMAGIDTTHLRWVLEEIRADGDVWVETFGHIVEYIRATHYTNDGWLWLPNQGTENNNLIESLYVHSSKIFYNLPFSMRVKFNIYDICGRCIKIIDEGKKPAGKHYIDLVFLPNGVYFVITQMDKKVYHNKLIILK